MKLWGTFEKLVIIWNLWILLTSLFIVKFHCISTKNRERKKNTKEQDIEKKIDKDRFKE